MLQTHVDPLWFDVELLHKNRSQKLKYGLCLREKQIPL